ncbi:MAG: ABC transporter ATP-binding protein [Candidatus Dormibacteraceae bacterium]
MPRDRSVPTEDVLLRVEQLAVGYGDVQVLWDIDLEIRRGEIVALIGSNGAGKSTLLAAISGLLRPRSGRIGFAGRSLERLSTQQIVDLGVIHVPEGRQLFPAMSVRDQLLLGAFRRRDRQAVAADLAQMVRLFPRIGERLQALASTLSGGEQQMVAIARALMARPQLLLIDELSLGLAPLVVESLMESITELNADGLTVLMVEQDVQAALERAARGYVLEVGHITMSGPARALLGDDGVRRAYLGI